MMHRLRTIRKPALTLAALCCASSLLVACGGDEEPVAVVQKAPPPKVEAPPPPPSVPTIQELMARLDIDQRVNLPEELAPATENERVAVLKFFDGFARGNAGALKPMLSQPDQFLLDEMTTSGAFAKSTGAISRIDVRCAVDSGSTHALAVFHVGEEYEPQLWTLASADSNPEFDSVATPPDIMNKISGDNPIEVWFAVVKRELAKAEEPDEQPELPKQDFTAEEGGGENSGGGDGAPSSAPGGSPGRRMPGAPIKAPKPPGFGTK
jgi:hypothetical protein